MAVEECWPRFGSNAWYGRSAWWKIRVWMPNVAAVRSRMVSITRSSAASATVTAPLAAVFTQPSFIA